MERDRLAGMACRDHGRDLNHRIVGNASTFALLPALPLGVRLVEGLLVGIGEPSCDACALLAKVADGAFEFGDGVGEEVIGVPSEWITRWPGNG